jgi:hypothetical protein
MVLPAKNGCSAAGTAPGNKPKASVIPSAAIRNPTCKLIIGSVSFSLEAELNDK